MTLAAQSILQNLEAANQNLHLFGIFASPGENDRSHYERTYIKEESMINNVHKHNVPLELSWHSNVCAVTHHDDDFTSYACAYESFQRFHQDR